MSSSTSGSVRRTVASFVVATLALLGVAVVVLPGAASASSTVCQADSGHSFKTTDTCTFVNNGRGVTFTHRLFGPPCSTPGVDISKDVCEPAIYIDTEDEPSCTGVTLSEALQGWQVNLTDGLRSFSCTSANSVPDVLDDVSDRGGFTYQIETVYFSPLPVAAFRATQASPARQPGVFAFDSSSTDAVGDGLTYRWAFGDGQTSSDGASVVHNYTRPGTYHASLTVTDAKGQTDSITHDIVVPATKLAVTASIVGDTGFVKPGQTVRVDVEVSAAFNGVGNVNHVAWNAASPGGLAVAPDAVGTVTPSAGNPALPGTFRPGDDLTFHYSIKIADDYTGSGSFVSHVDGTDDGGSVQSPSDSHNLKVSNHAIKVTIVPAKDTIVLKPDADGNPVPQQVDVTITVTNTSSARVDDVELDKLDLADADPEHPSDPFPVSVVGDNKGAHWPYLDPGSVKKVVVPLEITGDGSFALTDLEHSADGPVLGKGTLDVGLKTLLVVKIDGDTDRSVRAGQSVTFTGSYRNVSEDKTLAITDPSRVIRSGNLLGGGYIAAADAKADSAGFPAPLTGTIKPGQSLSFQVHFVTGEPTSADYETDSAGDPDWTQGKVSFAFAPHAALAEKDGTYSSLTTADPSTESKYPGSIKISGGTGGAFDVHVDTTAPSEANVLDRAVPAAFGFTIGALEGAEEKMTDLATLIADGAQLLATPFSDAFYSSSTYLSLQQAGRSAQVQDALKYLTDMVVWAPKSRLDELSQSVATNVHNSFDRFQSAIVDGVPHPEVPGTAELRKRLDAYLSSLQSAWDRDDPNAIVDALRPVGNATGGTATDFLVQEALLQGLLNAMSTTGSLYSQAKVAWSESKTIAEMEKNVPSAAEKTLELKAQKLSKSKYPLLEEAYATRRSLSNVELGIGTADNGAGLSVSTIDAARRVTTDNPDLLMVVIPNEANVAALRDAGLAVDKIENVKPKSMASLEKLVFGGRDEDLNCVVLRNLGKSWDDARVNAVVDQLIAAGEATESDRAVALQVLHDREAEWAAFKARGKPEVSDGKFVIKDGQYVPQRDANGHIVPDQDGIGRLAAYDEAGAIPNQFRGEDNKLTVSGEKQSLKFELEYRESAGGYAKVDAGDADYVVLKQENQKTGKLVKITGDDDGIFIGYRNGLGLRADEINEVYAGLTKVFNHPFSDTWLAGLDKKLKIFSKYFTRAPGTGTEGAPLIAFVNGQAYAVKIDPYATRFGPNNRALIKFEGLPTASGPSGTLRAFKKAFTAPVKPVPLSARYLQLFLGTQNAVEHPIQIQNARAAKIVRVGTDGNLQAWTPDTGWRDDPADQALAEQGQLAVAPQTTVSGDTKPGDVELAISTQPQNQMAGAWFQIGDEVVVDPGGPDEEDATIGAFGSLIFRHGLHRPHHVGELVAQLHAVSTRGGTSGHSGAAGPRRPLAKAGSPDRAGATAATGVDSARLLGIALTLLVLGGVVTVVGRRRRAEMRMRS